MARTDRGGGRAFGTLQRAGGTRADRALRSQRSRCEHLFSRSRRDAAGVYFVSNSARLARSAIEKERLHPWRRLVVRLRATFALRDTRRGPAPPLWSQVPILAAALTATAAVPVPAVDVVTCITLLRDQVGPSNWARTAANTA